MTGTLLGLAVSSESYCRNDLAKSLAFTTGIVREGRFTYSGYG